ncbi:MAG: hypothetical protein JWL71_425, partial [Acidobacteria bacterium]|nr:hypothetical protein [Acidobacteriota bacterium]
MAGAEGVAGPAVVAVVPRVRCTRFTWFQLASKVES